VLATASEVIEQLFGAFISWHCASTFQVHWLPWVAEVRTGLEREILENID
jgi:hypothetical protein